jgi:hypothetical protein
MGYILKIKSTSGIESHELKNGTNVSNKNKFSFRWFYLHIPND